MMQDSTNTPTPPSDRPLIQEGLVEALTGTYAALLKRQRAASAAFVRWSTANTRAHEFAWLPPGDEELMATGRELRIGPSHPIYRELNQMMATMQLNPYERDLLYGYPYVIGYVGNVPIRAPLLTIPITITTKADTLILKPNEELLRFNSLAFRSDEDTAAHELALGRLIDATPPFPLTLQGLNEFCQSVTREMKVAGANTLDGQLRTPPTQPRQTMALTLHSLGAVFIAPKTSYFLVNDLEEIGAHGVSHVPDTALGWLLGRRGNQPTSNAFDDTKHVYYPFSSNPSQRRLALLTNDPSVHIATVQGPPGTGKSLTLSNLACHLVAMGKRVLITSQKDKALEVVDELLRSLDMPELPMTLLRQDQDSKRELRQRLDSIDKDKSAAETQRQREEQYRQFTALADDTMQTEAALGDALHAEHLVAAAERNHRRATSFLQRIRTQWGLWEARRAARQRSEPTSDIPGRDATSKRASLLRAALTTLKQAAQHRTGTATRQERNTIREFSKLLGRNQSAAKNIPVFDRLKKEPDRCQALLKILPCWIMTPDDVARLFPLEPGLFDYVICDESSQLDLCAALPVLYRAKHAVIVGDSRQMRAQRLAFTNTQIATQAWRQYGMDRLDPDRWLDPTTSDLLQLATIRADESVLLNEHFRSLPGIISFSNHRWYGDQLRLMRDEADRRIGPPDQPYIEVVQVTDGRVTPGTQENEQEALQLVERLKQLLTDQAYTDASVGVLALFEEQVRLLNDLIAEHIPEELRTAHQLIVSNPDGVQGDERDIILYSLSYDAQGMEQAQLSARQAEREHIQGMLNVMFTRAREGMIIFHSAPIDRFGMASGQGAIKAWLEHCARVTAETPLSDTPPLKYTQSEFEAEVIQALHAQGLHIIPQFPACGYFIDLVATKNGQRLAIECDGEAWHLDEHGQLKLEDIVRQEILERAQWRVERIPYRGWQRTPEHYIQRILTILNEVDDEEDLDTPAPDTAESGPQLRLSSYEAAIIHALRQDHKDREAVLRAARLHLNYGLLSKSLRHTLDHAIEALVTRQLILIEEDELFLAEAARTASVSVYHAPRIPLPGEPPRPGRGPSRIRSRRYRRP